VEGWRGGEMERDGGMEIWRDGEMEGWRDGGMERRRILRRWDGEEEDRE
jgi:hypothetical protein